MAGERRRGGGGRRKGRLLLGTNKNQNQLNQLIRICFPVSFKTPVVVIMSRAHAGETPTSFVVQGLIDFLVSQHEIAKELREYVIFKVS